MSKSSFKEEKPNEIIVKIRHSINSLTLTHSNNKRVNQESQTNDIQNSIDI